jgi:Flp pilus assembly protein TadD
MRRGAQQPCGPLRSRGAGEGGAADAARLESAEGLARRALEIAPLRPEFHETAAAVAAARGELRSARRHLARAVRLDPGNSRYAESLRRVENLLEE